MLKRHWETLQRSPKYTNSMKKRSCAMWSWLRRKTEPGKTHKLCCYFVQSDLTAILYFILINCCYRIAAHRLVVSAASEYFKALLTGSMKESGMKEVSIGNVSGIILKHLIEYCYTGEFHIDFENVHDTLAATNMFGFDNLVAKCDDCLRSNVNVETCLDT